jgi:predicted transcriptional regulator
MYNNLKAEMARQGFTACDIAKCLEVSEKTVITYIEGTSKISWYDVLKIRNTLFPNFGVGYLFEISQQTA